MQIRKMNSDDFIRDKKEITALLQNIFETNSIATGEKAEEFALEKANQLGRFIEDGSAFVMAAFEEKELLGFAWLYKYEFAKEKRYHLTEIAVKGEYRNSGIGRAILNSAESEISKMGVSAIDLYADCENDRVQCFYEQLGFKKSRIHYVKKL